MGMTAEEKTRCEDIIYVHATAAAAANAAPVPGGGTVIDTAALVSMAIHLSEVFGGSISKSTAEAMVVAELKKSVGKQFIKELSKILPFGGQLVAPTVTFGLLTKAGWAIANQLANNRGW